MKQNKVFNNWVHDRKDSLSSDLDHIVVFFTPVTDVSTGTYVVPTQPYGEVLQGGRVGWQRR